MVDTLWQRGARELAGIARRLHKDVAGNTIAIVAAALIPLTAMIGSGVDMSRAYMAKQKLQQACDAGALAGRRVMTNDNLDDTVKGEVNKFVNFNFPQATYQTASFDTSITHPDKGIVQVQVSTTIPMTVMKMFGFQTLPLNVTCNASQNFVNTDIVLVLDVTGSMAQDPSGVDVGGGPTSKIVALRAAVLALYDQLKPVQDQLEANGMRLRYGIVPFSTTVNVGKLLYAKNPDYIAKSNKYESRTPLWTKLPTNIGIDANMCYNINNYTAYAPTYGYTKVEGGVWNSPTPGICTAVAGNIANPDGYVYAESTTAVDTTKFAQGSAINIFPMIGGVRADANMTSWDGCIEERYTDPTINASSGYTIPATANDLNLDLIPTASDVKTQWAPMWPDLVYMKEFKGDAVNQAPNIRHIMGQSLYYCPAEAKRLQAMNRSDLSTYLNTLTPIGSTYLDIGMIWGARFISPTGIFQSANPTTSTGTDPDNPTVYNGMPVNRHIIFMTDGFTQPTPYVYSAYGVEYDQHRVGAIMSSIYDTTDQENRHRQRFKMACNATKGLNVSLWTIYFGGTSVPAADQSALQGCASNTAQYASVANKDALIAKFIEIGRNIGALRLTQ